jgi:heme/copper-type cytochrome/quinol oxidase subunit 3
MNVLWDFFFLFCDLHDFHLFFGSVILLLKAKKGKKNFDYCAPKGIEFLLKHNRYVLH